MIRLLKRAWCLAWHRRYWRTVWIDGTCADEKMRWVAGWICYSCDEAWPQ